MTITKLLEKTYQRYEERSWDRLYLLLDVHETLLYPNYDGISDTFYEGAVEAMQLISQRPEMCIIMWTCSKPEDCQVYKKLLFDNGIRVDYINENPEVQDKFSWGDYTRKLYANLVFDDKAGFDPETDWHEIIQFYKQ
jgi:hypothetical protein